jgi:hypothetical protein
MVDELDIVFDRVSQFNRQSVWRIEEKLKIVGTILIVGTNSELTLLMDRVGESIFSDSDEVRIQKFGPILLKRGLEAVPCVEVIANDGGLALISERARGVKCGRFNMHRDLSYRGLG